MIIATKTKEINSGFSVHCYHNVLIAYCYDYAGRIAYLKANKPKTEQTIRLKVFKMLPVKALLKIPKVWLETDKMLREADKAWKKADEEWIKAYKNLQLAYNKWYKTYKKRQEMQKKWREVDKAWPQEAKKAFHKKWCGCKYWDGKKLVFTK